MGECHNVIAGSLSDHQKAWFCIEYLNMFMLRSYVYFWGMGLITSFFFRKNMFMETVIVANISDAIYTICSTAITGDPVAELELLIMSTESLNWFYHL